jgi:sugar phosphate isomerase/epimerase
VREIANWFRSTGTTFHSMHAPMHGDDEFGRTGAPPLNIAAVEKRDRIAAMDEIKRAIEVAEHAPFQFLVQHVGVGGESSSGQKIEAAMTSLEHLRAFAKPLGVQVVVENIPNDLSTPEGLLELLRTGHFTDIGVCLDVGHAHMSPGVTHALEALKDLIRTTHIHDNHGERDEHLWPGNGTIDWKQTIELLRTAPQVPALVLEIEGVDGGNVPEKMAESYKKLGV